MSEMDELADTILRRLQDNHPEYLDRMFKSARILAPGLSDDQVWVIFRRACIKALEEQASGKEHEEVCRDQTEEAMREVVQILALQEQHRLVTS